jgi:hypothetical protein
MFKLLGKAMSNEDPVVRVRGQIDDAGVMPSLWAMSEPISDSMTGALSGEGDPVSAPPIQTGDIRGNGAVIGGKPSFDSYEAAAQITRLNLKWSPDADGSPASASLSAAPTLARKAGSPASTRRRSIRRWPASRAGRTSPTSSS